MTPTRHRKGNRVHVDGEDLHLLLSLPSLRQVVLPHPSRDVALLNDVIGPPGHRFHLLQELLGLLHHGESPLKAVLNVINF